MVTLWKNFDPKLLAPAWIRARPHQLKRRGTQSGACTQWPKAPQDSTESQKAVFSGESFLLVSPWRPTEKPSPCDPRGSLLSPRNFRHISPGDKFWARTVFHKTLGATRRTSFRSWFLVYQRVLPQACLLQQTSMTPSRQEVDHPTFFSTSSTSPTTTVLNDSGTQANEDLSGKETHPVPVSSSHLERTERGDTLLPDAPTHYTRTQRLAWRTGVLHRGPKHPT